MAVDHHYQSASSLRSVLTFIVTPIQYLVAAPIEVVRWVDNTITTRRILNQENIRLHSEKLFLQAKMQEINALSQENNELRLLLNASKQIKAHQFKAAEFKSVDLAPFIHQVVINKGSEEGVYEGQPVIDAHGVLGQVVTVSKHDARVILITDGQSAVPVQSVRNGERAIATGQGDSPYLKLLYVHNTADFKKGDLLVTSGLGKRYLEGYPVGEIISVTHQVGDRFSKVVVKPKGRLNRSRHVLLVWPNKDSHNEVVANKG